MTPKEQAARAIETAMQFAREKPSQPAMACCENAQNLFDLGAFQNAISAARQSLLYTVGVWHPAYQRLTEA